MSLSNCTRLRLQLTLMVFDDVRRPIVGKPERKILAAGGVVSANANEVAERVFALRTQIVAAVDIEFRVDRVEDRAIHAIGVFRRG